MQPDAEMENALADLSASAVYRERLGFFVVHLRGKRRRQQQNTQHGDDSLASGFFRAVLYPDGSPGFEATKLLNTQAMNAIRSTDGGWACSIPQS